MQILQTEINKKENINPTTGNVSKNLSYHTSHTDFMYQRNTTKNGNRRQFVIQSHSFTYQRKGNHELQLQALQIIVAGLQNLINYHQVEVVVVVVAKLALCDLIKNIIIISFIYIQICGTSVCI